MKEKQSYLAKMAEQLNKWDKDLDILKAKVDKMSIDTKQEYESIINDLKKRKDTVNEKIRESQSSGSEAWTELKQGIDASYNELTKAFSHAVDKIKNS